MGCFFYILLANKNLKHVYSITVTWKYSSIALHILIWYTHSYYSLCMICLCLLKDTTYTDRSASYLDLHLKTECEWGLRTKTNFPTKEMILIFLLWTFHLYVAATPAYGVYISQFIRYSRDCGSYQDFIDRGLLLTRKLLNQGFLLVKLKS